MIPFASIACIKFSSSMDECKWITKLFQKSKTREQGLRPETEGKGPTYKHLYYNKGVATQLVLYHTHELS
jgi:hypothetical protein